MQHRINHILYLDLGISCQLLWNPIKSTPRLFTTLLLTPSHRTAGRLPQVCKLMLLNVARAPSTQNLGHQAKRLKGIYESLSNVIHSSPSTHPFCLEQSQRWRQRGRFHIANIQHLPILAGLFLRRFLSFSGWGIQPLAGRWLGLPICWPMPWRSPSKQQDAAFISVCFF